MLAILLWVSLGSFVAKPLDYDFNYNEVEQVSTQTIQQPLFEWQASWYDYKLWGERWSKSHDTCALRIYDRHKKYKVCADDRCVVCYHNDYWPQRQDRVVDLSSHAFKQLAPLSKGLIYVKVYNVSE